MSKSPPTTELIAKLIELAAFMREDPQSGHMRASQKFMHPRSQMGRNIEDDADLTIFIGTLLANNCQAVVLRSREAVLLDTSVPPEDDLLLEEFFFYSLVIDGVEFDLRGNVGEEKIKANIVKQTTCINFSMYGLGEACDANMSSGVLPLIGDDVFRQRWSKRVLEVFFGERAHALDQQTMPANHLPVTRHRI